MVLLKIMIIGTKLHIDVLNDFKATPIHRKFHFKL